MTIYIIKGKVSDVEAYDAHAAIGDTEYQFSDGPANIRGYSSDFISLRKGLEHHADAEFDVADANFTPEEQAIFEDFCNTRPSVQFLQDVYDEDGESFTRYRLITKPPAGAANWAREQFPSYGCTHAHDCCGKFYPQPAHVTLIEHTKTAIISQRYLCNV